MRITKAIFPIAGLGTRFLPATKASPKEMLPIVDKPLIQYAVEEAYAAGIRQMIFVTGRGKRAVEDHFDMNFELEAALENECKTELLQLVQAIKPHNMHCVYIRQPQTLGLGHAVLCAAPLIQNEPFTVLLADDLMIGDPPVLTQMITQFEEHNKSIIAVQNVDKESVRQYGIASGSLMEEHLIDIDFIVEKPEVSSIESTLAVVGRYIFTPRIFDALAIQKKGIGGEIQLTDAIAALLKTEKVYAYLFRGKRYDCGTKLGFLQATVELAEKNLELGLAFSSWLETR